ncbi:MAG: hypothetical protein LBC74_12440 [Planctomycetaceae bacterium]|nr:hypothetical protein [Planctomycetaceae bacterium]
MPPMEANKDTPPMEANKNTPPMETNKDTPPREANNSPPSEGSGVVSYRLAKRSNKYLPNNSNKTVLRFATFLLAVQISKLSMQIKK